MAADNGLGSHTAFTLSDARCGVEITHIGTGKSQNWDEKSGDCPAGRDTAWHKQEGKDNYCSVKLIRAGFYNDGALCSAWWRNAL